jgi:Lar family restriction alleviation protein
MPERAEGEKMAKETLKSCPFCGSKRVEVARTNENACWIECEKCGAEAQHHPTRAGAFKNWNRRRKASVAKIVWDMDKQ